MYATGSHLALKALLLGLAEPAPSAESRLDETRSSVVVRSDDPRAAAPGTADLARALRVALEDADITGFLPRKLWEPVKTTVTAPSEVAGASFVVAEVSQVDPGSFFYLGLAHSLGKTVVALKRFDAHAADPVFRLADVALEYDQSIGGVEDLIRRFRAALETIKRQVLLDIGMVAGGRADEALDWSKLGRESFANLCMELFLREGYSGLEWLALREITLMGFRAGSDGTRDLFLFSLGGGLADLQTVELLVADFQDLVPRISDIARRQNLAASDGRIDINLYFVWWPENRNFTVDKAAMQELAQRMGAIARASHLPFRLRASWLERRRLEGLVARYPILLRKYFSDENDAVTDRRKSLEELYHEAVALGQKATEVSDGLEKKYGVDPGLEWQERAYTVTHSIGNAIFPVETYLDLIREIFAEGANDDGENMAALALESLEKAKVHIRKFKNIARLKRPELEAVEVLSRIELSLSAAAAKGIQVDWYVGEHPAVRADPDLFDELIDELVANGITWLEGSEERKIAVTVKIALPDDLSRHLVRSAGFGPKTGAADNFVWIRFEDSGPGVPTELKERIFDLFYSTNPSGMGFGLAIVRKNLRDFGGDIVETGQPGHGARFDLFLPFARRF